jgi:peroxiredoxin
LYKEVIKVNVRSVIGTLVLVGLVIGVAFNYVKDDTRSINQTENEQRSSEGLDPLDTGLKVGERAPDFELESLDGDKIRLSDLRGKTVILNLWATWCGPCEEEMPAFQQFYQDHKDKDLEILAVNMTSFETEKDAIVPFVNKYGLTFPILLDKEAKVAKAYNIYNIPLSYFINADGVIKQKAGPMTYEQMENMLIKTES